VTRRAAVATGAIAGLAGALTFAALHAVIIVPIWDRMTMGMVFGAGAGAAAGWAFAELKTPASPRSGAAFGAWLFATTIPATLAAAVFRATGFMDRQRSIADVVAVALAIAAGASVGWWRHHHWRAAVAMAAAALCLTAAMGGPVPALRNARAGGIYAAVLVASLAGGTLLGWRASRSARPPS